MPNKYSHASVLSYYESRGWIQSSRPPPLPSEHTREATSFSRLSLIDSSGSSTPEPRDLNAVKATPSSVVQPGIASPPGLASGKPVSTSWRYSMAAAPNFAPVKPAPTITSGTLAPAPTFPSVKPAPLPTSTSIKPASAPILAPVKPNSVPTSTSVKPAPTYASEKLAPFATFSSINPILHPTPASVKPASAPILAPVKSNPSPTFFPGNAAPSATFSSVQPAPSHTLASKIPTSAPSFAIVKPPASTTYGSTNLPSSSASVARKPVPSPPFSSFNPTPSATSTSVNPISYPTYGSDKPPSIPVYSSDQPTLSSAYFPDKPTSYPPFASFNPASSPTLTAVNPASSSTFNSVNPDPYSTHPSVKPTPPSLRSTTSVITQIYAPENSSPSTVQERHPTSPCPSHVSFDSLSPIESIFDLNSELQTHNPARAAPSLITSASSESSLKETPHSSISPIRESPILKPMDDFSLSQESFPYRDCSFTPWEDPSASSTLFRIQSPDDTNAHALPHLSRSPSPDDAAPPPIFRSRRTILACNKSDRSPTKLVKQNRQRHPSDKVQTRNNSSSESMRAKRASFGEWIGRSKLDI